MKLDLACYIISTSLLHARRTELNLKMFLIKRYQQSSPLPKLITSFNEVKLTTRINFIVISEALTTSSWAVILIICL